MPILDDAEPYFGKPGEVIVVGLSGARTYSRIDGPNREAQEPARNSEMRSSASSISQQNSGQYSNAGGYQQTQSAAYRGGGGSSGYEMHAPQSRALQQYSDYSSQGARQQTAAATYASSRQYTANSPGSYHSTASSRYY